MISGQKPDLVSLIWRLEPVSAKISLPVFLFSFDLLKHMQNKFKVTNAKAIEKRVWLINKGLQLSVFKAHMYS